ncbi:MAG: 4Fe-4S binding protein [Chloroflexi bacterium]|nr:4Fe-4S binding protein [Chloroflexota bacterium]
MKAKQKAAPPAATKALAPQEKPGWTDIPIGAVVVEAGNGVNYQTGDWRSERPVVDVDKCIHCLFCWVFCPDNAVVLHNEKFKSINYYHCKGCGICSAECPVKVITMVEEAKAQSNANDSGAADGDGNLSPKAVGKGG